MNQICVFLCFILLGIIMGIVYDVFKIIRVYLFSNNIFIFFLDIIYFIIYTLCIFLLNIMVNMGYVRYFFIWSSFFGVLLHKVSVSSFFFRFIERMRSLFFIRKMRRGIRKWLLCTKKCDFFLHFCVLWHWIWYKRFVLTFFEGRWIEIVKVFYGGKRRYDMLIRFIILFVFALSIYTVTKQRIKIRYLEGRNIELAKQICECKGE